MDPRKPLYTDRDYIDGQFQRLEDLIRSTVTGEIEKMKADVRSIQSDVAEIKKDMGIAKFLGQSAIWVSGAIGTFTMWALGVFSSIKSLLTS